MKTIFTFDLERGYQPNDIFNYSKLLQRLMSSYPWNHEFRCETLKNTQEDWIKLQTLAASYPLAREGYDTLTLYIFFEMPEKVQNDMKFCRLPYLNFMTSKIRFPGLEDTIMVESNLDIGPSIREEELKKFIPRPFDSSASMFEYKKYTEDRKLFSGKTIALGQMYGDRSVIFDGKAHTIFDYEFKADIYRPHPHAVLYQPEYHKQQVELAKARGLEVITEGNIYQILHSCKKVIGISSSTLYEAELMKKEVAFLNEKDYIRRGKMVRWENINEEFWKKIRSQV